VLEGEIFGLFALYAVGESPNRSIVKLIRIDGNARSMKNNERPRR